MNNMCEHCINSVLENDKMVSDDTDECRSCLNTQTAKKKVCEIIRTIAILVAVSIFVLAVRISRGKKEAESD